MWSFRVFVAVYYFFHFGVRSILYLKMGFNIFQLNYLSFVFAVQHEYLFLHRF